MTTDTIVFEATKRLRHFYRHLTDGYLEKKTIENKGSHQGILSRIDDHRMIANVFLTMERKSLANDPVLSSASYENPIIQAIAQDMLAQINELYGVLETDVKKSAALSGEEGRFKKAWRLLSDDYSLEERKSNILQKYMAQIIKQYESQLSKITSAYRTSAYLNKGDPEKILRDMEKLLVIKKPELMDYYVEKRADVNSADTIKANEFSMFRLHQTPLPSFFPRFQEVANTILKDKQIKQESSPEATPIFSLGDIVSKHTRDDLSFSALFDRYSELAKSLDAQVSDEQLASYTSILSNASVRDIFRLEDKFYSPMALDATIEKKIKEADKMEQFVLVQTLKGAIEQGKNLLTEYQSKQENTVEVVGPRFGNIWNGR